MPLLLILNRLKSLSQRLLRLLLPLHLLFLHLSARRLRCSLRLRGVDFLLARGFISVVGFAGFAPVLALHFEDAPSVVGHGAVVVVMIEVGAGIGGAVVTAGAGRGLGAGAGAGEFLVVGLGAGEEGGEEAHC